MSKWKYACGHMGDDGTPVTSDTFEGDWDEMHGKIYRNIGNVAIPIFKLEGLDKFSIETRAWFIKVERID